MTWGRVKALSPRSHKASPKRKAGVGWLHPNLGGLSARLSGPLAEPSDSPPPDQTDGGHRTPTAPRLWHAGPAPRPRIERTRGCAQRAESPRTWGPYPSPSRVLPAHCGEVTTSVDLVHCTYVERTPPAWCSVRWWSMHRVHGTDGERRRLWPGSRGPAPDRTIWGKRCLCFTKEAKHKSR